MHTARLTFVVILSVSLLAVVSRAEAADQAVAISFAPTALHIHQTAQPHQPFSVSGESGAILGQQDGSIELWQYPVKIFSHLRIKAELENYSVPIDVNEQAATIDVDPDHTTITFSHAAFSVRMHMFVSRQTVRTPSLPVIVFEVHSVRRLHLTFQMDPDMQRMWPALNPGRPSVSWSQKEELGIYRLDTDDPTLRAALAMPGAMPGILAPYQERPKNYPLEFHIAYDPKRDAGRMYPLLALVSDSRFKSGQTSAEMEAKLLELNRELPALYASARDYYRHFFDRRLTIATPDERLNKALQWAEVSMDQLKVRKGSEVGLIAGLYPAGDSNRPGFGWFFGRDTLWSSYALNSEGDFAATREALEFLLARQRADGKIMHEFSQAAEFVDWAHLPYQFASADATPLLLMAMDDYVRQSGDREFLLAHWKNVEAAWKFLTTHDADGDGVYDNSEGTGWVESWPIHMPHQEFYLAALDAEASTAMARLAVLHNEEPLRQAAASRAVHIAVQLEHYLGTDGVYAFSHETDGHYDRTPAVFPAVAWWSNDLALAHPEKMLDLFASEDLSADWGTRAVARSQAIYDPISYHQGSIWPLFTGWAAMAEYRAHRPQAGLALLNANADLIWRQDPGNATELLSGDLNEPLGRSTAHQLWSAAMIVTPLVRGLLGIEADVPHRMLTLAPQLPPSWRHVEVQHVAFGDQLLTVQMDRAEGKLHARVIAPEPVSICLTSIAARNNAPCTAYASKTQELTIPLPPVELDLPHRISVAGSSDVAPRILGEQWIANRFEFVVEAPAGSQVEIPVEVNLPAKRGLKISGAVLYENKLTVAIPAGGGWQRTQVSIAW